MRRSLSLWDFHYPIFRPLTALRPFSPLGHSVYSTLMLIPLSNGWD